jgi:haloalkane dehalogenase
MFDRVRAYDDWLATRAHVPKLLLAFDGSAQTLLIGPGQTAWCAASIANLDIENCGPTAHLALEDKPEAIAAAIANWADRH